MQKLKFADATFLYAETANAPMNIASVQVLDVPEQRRANYFNDLYTHLENNVGRIPFMTRRLVDAPMAVDQPIWVTDKNFDLSRHVVRTTLNAPGSMPQLERLISQLHEQPLNRRYPLWKFYLIEGLENGQCALYTKYHHACIDGMAGQQIIDVLFSNTPDGEPVTQPAFCKPESAPSLADQWVDAIVNAAVEPVLTMLKIPQTTRALQEINRIISDRATAGAYAQTAPNTPFNTTVSKYRNVCLGTLPLDEVRTLSKRYRTSINDTFLCVCAGALSRYLKRIGKLPAQPLVASIPVSLRKPSEAALDNRVSMMLASLATDLDEPIERLNAIKNSTACGKRIVAKLALVPTADPHIPGLPIIATSMAQFAESLHLADNTPAPANVLISNVPGPRKQKYLLGAVMITHYPVSIAANGMALNITVQSYLDRMDFSITSCLEAVPDADLLRDDMLEAWEELRSTSSERSNDNSDSSSGGQNLAA